MSEAEQPLQEHEVTGVMTLDEKKRTLTIGKTTVQLSQGLWSNITRNYHTNDYVKVSYVKQGEKKKMRSVVRM